MRETLAAALRGDGNPPPADGDDARPPGQAGVGAEQQGVDRLNAIIEAIGGLSQGGRQRKAAEDKAVRRTEGLQKYLDTFEKEKATVQVPKEAVIGGSEAHEKLRRGFERRYEEEEDGKGEGEKAKRGHDEL
jgi:hypothetical protein